MPYLLSVDLGTTFTAAATASGGEPAMVGLGNRALQIPSVLFLADEGFVVGEAAERRGLVEPARVVREFKRRLGDHVPVLVAGSPYSADALMAQLLSWVVAQVSERMGEPPTGVVLTHPASWGPFKLEALNQVGVIADIGPTQWCAEPVAAAAQYAARVKIKPGDRLAVYDLGGGTFDICVLEKTETGFAMLGAPEGVEHLGGADFDEALFQLVRRGLGDRLAEADPDDPQTTSGLARLRRDCVEAKEALSSEVEVTVPVTLPGVGTSVRVTRAEFEGLIRPTLQQTVDAMHRALRAAAVTPAELASIVLVGGSSRIPLVGEMLQREFGVGTAIDTHPKHDLALGAVRLIQDLGASPAAVAAGIASRPVPMPITRPQREPSPASGPTPLASTGPAAPRSPAPGAAGPPPSTAPPKRRGLRRPKPAVERPAVAWTPPSAAAVAPAAAATVAPPSVSPSSSSAASPASAATPGDRDPSGPPPGQPPPPAGRQPDGRPPSFGPAPPAARWRPSRTLVVAAVVLLVAVGGGVAVGLGVASGNDPTAGPTLAIAPTASASASTGTPTPIDTPSPSPTLPALPRSEPLSDTQLIIPMMSDGNWDLYLADVDRPNPVRRLTTSKAWDTFPSLSPDRSTVAYVRRPDDDGPRELRVARAADGKQDRSLFPKLPKQCAQAITRPAWNPVDPTMLASVCADADDEAGLFEFRTDGTVIRQIDVGSNVAIGDPAFSPDGKRLVFWASRDKADGGTLHTAPVDGSQPAKRLVTTTLPGQDADPAWPRDGESIVFRRRSGSADNPGDLNIWVVSVATGKLEQLTRDRADEQDPIWSPDGDQIAFKSGQAVEAWPGKALPRIWVMGSNGSNPRLLLTEDAPGEQTAAAWNRR